MNKKHFIQLLLGKHQKAEVHLEDKCFKFKDLRYKRKDFIEGYKYALLEIQSLVESFRGDEIKNEKGQTNEIDKEFIEQIKFQAKNV